MSQQFQSTSSHQGSGLRLSLYCFWNPQRSKYLRFLAIFMLVSALSSLSASAQSLPPGPQPGSGADPGAAAVASLGNNPTKTQDPSSNLATITSSRNGPILATEPPQSFPTTSALPKAPQSVIVVQSTVYGNALPAVAPVDDHVETHLRNRKASSDGRRGLSPPAFIWSFMVTSMVLVAMVSIGLVRL